MSIQEYFTKTNKLYHFTTFDTALKIIESNRLRFGRLSNMNDIHENDKLVFHNDNDQKLISFSSELLDAFFDEIYKYRQISLTAEGEAGDKDGFDLHQMWGLYADKGEGVCFVFDKDELTTLLNPELSHSYRVCYKETKDLDSFYVSDSFTPDEIRDEVKRRVSEIFFHKRKEWEHEQEYRIIKRCPNPNKEEYLWIGKSLKFIIVSSKLCNIDEVLYLNNIKAIKEKYKKTGNNRIIGTADGIPLLIYGNGLFDYSLITEDGREEIWNNREGYDVLVLKKNCELDLTNQSDESDTCDAK